MQSNWSSSNFANKVYIDYNQFHSGADIACNITVFDILLAYC